MVSITLNMIPHEVKIQMENLTKVKTLIWNQVIVDRLDQLLLFSADTFPNLQTLSIEHLRVNAALSYQSLSYSYPNQFASLRMLSLEVEKSTMPLLSALSSNVIVPVENIDTLDLWITGWTTLGCLDSILKATAPTLRVLQLHVNIYDSFLDDPGFELVPSLRQMANLKSLRFMRYLSRGQLIWMRNILRTMSCAICSLESIHLGFSQADLDFALLEHAILEQKTPNIKVIIERVEQRNPELLDALKQSFLELSRRGQIHFVGWD
ncbi:hypothetical protein C0992_008277 [Termitomyces sp. T32_za158]|nr:hypothetical protein C0992_008277 [Termitomyces sp. T32_za158]